MTLPQILDDEEVIALDEFAKFEARLAEKTAKQDKCVALRPPPLRGLLALTVFPVSPSAPRLETSRPALAQPSPFEPTTALAERLSPPQPNASSRFCTPPPRFTPPATAAPPPPPTPHHDPILPLRTRSPDRRLCHDPHPCIPLAPAAPTTRASPPRSRLPGRAREDGGGRGTSSSSWS